METAQSGSKKAYSALLASSSVIILFLCSTAFAFKPKSSATFGVGTDSEKSPTGFFDIQIVLPFMMQLNFGAASTRVNFEEQGEGVSRDYYLALGSNPLRDWVFELQMELSDPSDHLKVGTLKASVQHFIGDFALRLTVGGRTIRAKITDRLLAVCNLVNFAGACSTIAGSQSEVVDQKGLWGLDAVYFITERWSFRANYYDYRYEKDLSLFSDERIVNVDYFADTISYASGFLDNRSGLGISYDWSQYSLSWDFAHFVNQFNSDKTGQSVLSFGWQMTTHWYLNFSLGASRSEAEGETEAVPGTFSNIAVSYSW